MNTFFEGVTRHLVDCRAERNLRPSRLQRGTGRCHCRRPVFFNNSICLACQATLGYVPALLEVRSFLPGPPPADWRLAAKPGEDAPPIDRDWRRCANFDSPAGCNWMVSADAPSALCVACRLNRTIPNLSFPLDAARWRKIEAAKRRLIAQLLELGLPVRSKLDDARQGLAFDFLTTLPGQPRVLTGHLEGVVTLNIEEADDVVREQIRSAMNEPDRTLLGHLRHEVGHYYWELLVARTGWLDPFRQLFGDERADYAAAVQRNYSWPPPADWPLHHVSAYASIHPWEDWAETWAQYLQIIDTLATAVGFGLGGNDVDFEAAPFTRESLCDPDDPDADAFLILINSWVELTAVLNELARSLGQRDHCPSVLSTTAVAKLHFVHLVVTGGGPAA